MNLDDIKHQLTALRGPEQKFCAETAPAHAGIDEIHESTEWEVCNALYDTIIKEGYTKILEVGTHMGASTAWILLALETQKKGALETYDVQEWERSLWREVGIPEEKLIKHVVPKVTVFDFKNLYHSPAKIDLCFVDALHAVDETMAFVNLFAPRIKKGGQLVFHDNFSYRAAINIPLVKYFNDPKHHPHWLTMELPIGCGCFIARKI